MEDRRQRAAAAIEQRGNIRVTIVMKAPGERGAGQMGEVYIVVSKMGHSARLATRYAVEIMLKALSSVQRVAGEYVLLLHPPPRLLVPLPAEDRRWQRCSAAFAPRRSISDRRL